MKELQATHGELREEEGDEVEGELVVGAAACGHQEELLLCALPYLPAVWWCVVVSYFFQCTAVFYCSLFLVGTSH